MKELSCYFYFLVFIIGFTFPAKSQNKLVSNRAYIEKLISSDSISKAKVELKNQLDYFRKSNSVDSLVAYINLVGHEKLANNDSKKAISNAEKFVAEIKNRNNDYYSKEALLALANLYATSRLFQENYNINKEALIFANKINPINKGDFSQIEYNLGTAAIDMQNLSLGQKHLYNSKNILEANPKIAAEQFYLTYNSIGRIKAKLLEIDSSNFYYNKSLKALGKMENLPVNKYYKAAIVKQNIALNLFNSGNPDEAIKMMKGAILDFQYFINLEKNDIKTPRAIRFRLASIDNLGVFYAGIGDNNNAIDVTTYSLEEKLKILSEEDPNVILSNLIVGHGHLIAKNYELAAKYIDAGLKHINKTPFYEDYALLIRASVYDNVGDIENAKKIYQRSEALYRVKNKDMYSLDFLEALTEMSLFYAKHGMAEKAITLAKESYDHTHSKSFENNITKFKHTENIALVNYELKYYKDALAYSNEALEMNLKMHNKLDSIQNEMSKPRVLYINAKSKYNLINDKSISFLESLLSQIEQGIKILEKRKTIVNNSDDVTKLIADNNDLFNFEKQLYLDLYNKTKDKKYLNELVSTHESSIYNRIRSRLNLKSNIEFANVSKKITDREKALKQKLTKSLTNSETINEFFTANDNWNVFLDSLKYNHPDYYKMRYETIKQPLNTLQNSIPKNTIIVRYVFINDLLYVYLINSKESSITKLTSSKNELNHLKKTIQSLSENQSDVKITSLKLLKLYQLLWQPIASKISVENVIIIPDGDLFNLSFETLTPKKINNFSELSTNSLLAKYNISYNYSLLLIKNNKPSIYNSNFVAFAPEFNDKMKSDYKFAITDSLALDKTYLTLLPQPFSVDIAQQYSELFNGSAYINKNATKQIFENSAKEHKIIHIGTHAESNNLSPELSRLIFAKNTTDENNSLYTYEIYNQNLSSNLAILTACETGKPTYQSGEGMISLAHAFNYAGSESILTSLWKIDEQSSAKITELFYNYIKKGWAKDKALRQAKLDYIATAEGRMINPQYWAGLVLIGDTSAINIKSDTNYVFIILIVLVLIIILIFSKKYLNHKKATKIN
ncbi:CHAT domain-containing protein [Aquaticitalea lipolytica]|uniref:CHAT domain-containing protein n=1 Tax=Aquaticitalea lipolytica TaxID=1247562 RepID=UPI0024BA785F|nr:CHAT domain-containing protein [Aquaticitalea lipolytica]